jgi:uncharacterized protein (UPF0276 family)
LGPLRDTPDAPIDFFEVAPGKLDQLSAANTARRSGRSRNAIRSSVMALSLSLGGPAPLDETLLHKIRRLLDEHGIRYYSEHLSFCSDDGHLYDLMPIPSRRKRSTGSCRASGAHRTSLAGASPSRTFLRTPRRARKSAKSNSPTRC